jgi:serine/threonine-protein kinase HipA
MSQLFALMDGQWMGTVTSLSSRLSFDYADQWYENPDAYPISLSMPMSTRRHGRSRIEPFLWGLLPDNEQVLQNLGQRYHVSPRNVFRLLAHVGEDVAGAVQLVRPERLETVLDPDVAREVEWLSKDDVAQRLQRLREDPSSRGRTARDTGQFSLAGAQPKTALLLEGNRWGIPSGRTPTTHILKPSTREFVGHAENEHFSLQLASTLGLIVPESNVQRFGNEVAIVVKRYDRLFSENTWHRLHQEDLCQALGNDPTQKYESEGGPGVRQITELLRNQSSSPEEDIRSFAEALAFNWLIAGTDAHAKNYSLLLGSGGLARMAPLYDLASILPYSTHNRELHGVNMAMRIGGEYQMRMIAARHWIRAAGDLHISSNWLLDRLRTMAVELPDFAATVRNQMTAAGLEHPTVTLLTEQLARRATVCLRMLNRPASD